MIPSRSASNARRASRWGVSPWWCEEPQDSHVCGDCEKPFADEAVFYCHACGCDLCPECVEVLEANREVFCSRCAAESFSNRSVDEAAD